MQLDIQLNKLNKSHWIKSVGIARELIDKNNADIVNIHLATNAIPSTIESWHIVSLACLLEYTYRKGAEIRLYACQETINFLSTDLHLTQYFQQQSHIDSESDTILNLWKIRSSEALMYSIRLARYLKQKYFHDKDISMLQTMLDELYANVADHSKSDGIAYSFIKYDKDREVISVAFCDFGIGIPKSLILNNQHPQSREDYIKYATRRGVTVRSSEHNAGYGLATVLDCMKGSNHYLRIISNNELYYHLNVNGNISEKTFILNNPFNGTLIYYNIDISQFQNEEILGSGDLLNDLDW